MSAIGIGTSGVGGQLFGVSVLTMGSIGGPGCSWTPLPTARIALNASGLFVCALNSMEIVMSTGIDVVGQETSFTL